MPETKSPEISAMRCLSAVAPHPIRIPDMIPAAIVECRQLFSRMIRVVPALCLSCAGFFISGAAGIVVQIASVLSGELFVHFFIVVGVVDCGSRIALFVACLLFGGSFHSHNCLKVYVIKTVRQREMFFQLR